VFSENTQGQITGTNIDCMRSISLHYSSCLLCLHCAWCLAHATPEIRCEVQVDHSLHSPDFLVVLFIYRVIQ